MKLASMLFAGGIVLAGQTLFSPPGLQTAGAQDQAVTENKNAVAWETIILPARYRPVGELAGALGTIFQGEPDVAVEADASANLLLIRVKGERKAEILDMIRKLDRRPATAQIQVMLLKATKPLDAPERLSGPLSEVLPVIRELEADGQAYVARQLSLTALENSKATLMVGENRAVLQGVSSLPARGVPSRGFVRNYADRQFGTMLSLEMRSPEESRVLLEVQLEISELAEAEIDVDDEQAASGNFTPPGTSTMTCQATLDLESGSARLVKQAIQRSRDGRQQGSYLIFAATLQGGEPRTTTTTALSRSAPPRRPDAGNQRRRVAPPVRPADADRSVDARYLNYATAIVKKYDADGDGKLNAAERAKMSNLSRNYDQADTNDDGSVTPEELARFMQQR